MKNLIRFCCGLLLINGLFSCTGNEVKDRTSKIRLINASTISGDINLYLDNQKVYATNIEYLNFSLFSEHISTKHAMQIKGVSGNILADTYLDMVYNKTYSIFMYDSSSFVRYKIIEDNFVTPKGSYCKLRFLHLSNNAPAVDIRSNIDTSVLYTDYSNGEFSDFSLRPADSAKFAVHETGNLLPFNEQQSSIYMKAGSFYTMFLRGSIGATGKDTIGLFVIENNGNY